MKMNTLVMTILSLTLFTGAAHAAEAGSEEQGQEKILTNFFPTKTADRSKATRPPQATLVEPKPLATVTATDVTLKWNAIPTADHYVLQVETDPNFKWTIFVDNNYQKTSFDVKGLQKGQMYFWRVAGVKQDNTPGYTQGFYTSSSFEAK